MAFDGSGWDESTPTNANLANEIDDNMRDMKTGVRGRIAQEHLWPSSQSATAEAGLHRYVTLAGRTAAPALVVGTNTQCGAVYALTNGNLVYVDSASNAYTIVIAGKGPVIQNGTGNIGDLPYVTSGGGLVGLPAATSGYLLTAQGTTAAPAYAARSRDVQAWVTFAGGNGAIADNYGVASVASNAAGSYSITFDVAFADTTYAIVGNANQATVDYVTKGTSSCSIRTLNYGNPPVQYTPTEVSMLFIGSQ